jgi:acyl-CoA thioester hydrolase
MAYFKDFEVRWSDVDANRHLANSAYINFMSHTRMAYFEEAGLGYKALVQNKLGPVVFYEHMYYFKEVFPGDPIRVSLEFTGMSNDGMFFEFRHDFYDGKGKNVAHCEMMGAWISLETRRLTRLNAALLGNFSSFERADNFRILTKEDTRRFKKAPKDLD